VLADGEEAADSTALTFNSLPTSAGSAAGPDTQHHGRRAHHQRPYPREFRDRRISQREFVKLDSGLLARFLKGSTARLFFLAVAIVVIDPSCDQ